jgi:ribosomal protein L10
MHKAERSEVVEGADRAACARARRCSWPTTAASTNSELAGFGSSCVKHGPKLSVVKNTLTRRGGRGRRSEGLLALLEGPTAIAFVTPRVTRSPSRRPSPTARGTRRSCPCAAGILSGQRDLADEIERLAKLPPLETLQAQLVGVIVAR